MFIAVLLGILIELAQKYFTTTRQCDIWDVAANSAGSFVGILAAVKLFQLKENTIWELLYIKGAAKFVALFLLVISVNYNNIFGNGSL